MLSTDESEECSGDCTNCQYFLKIYDLQSNFINQFFLNNQYYYSNSDQIYSEKHLCAKSKKIFG